MLNLSIGSGGQCAPSCDPKWQIQQEIVTFVTEYLEIEDDEKRLVIYNAVDKWIQPKQYQRKLSVWEWCEILTQLGFNAAILGAMVLASIKYLT